MKVIDLSGSKYGKLRALSRDDSRKSRVFWLCRCDCGSLKSVSADKLRAGTTISCGCMKISRAGNLNKSHGMTNTKEYRAWRSMINRCYNKKVSSYGLYGGRGISVHKDWIGSFQSFYSHIGEAPSPRHSIDRINYNGNYEPGNVRWATDVEQANNRRNNRIVEDKGITRTLSQYCNDNNIDYNKEYRKRYL